MTTLPRHVTGGVDTHLDVHVAAALDERGTLLGVESFATTADSYKKHDAHAVDDLHVAARIRAVGAKCTGQGYCPTGRSDQGLRCRKPRTPPVGGLSIRGSGKASGRFEVSHSTRLEEWGMPPRCRRARPRPGIWGTLGMGQLRHPISAKLRCDYRAHIDVPQERGAAMQAITVRDRTAGVGGLSLMDVPYPHAAQNDVIVRVHAAGFTPGELDWSSTWVDRAGRDRTPSVPGHELSGVVVELGYGTTGLTVGQRVFGTTDWTRNGSLAEYSAVEARNLAPLPADIDHTMAAALPISGLTAWQALIDHAHLTTGQSVLIHGAAGGVGSIAVQLAREIGAKVIGTGRAADRDTALGLGVDAFLDLEADKLEDAGEVDVVFDVIGGDILDRSAALVRAGGTLVTTIRVPTVQPKDGRAVFFVVEADRSRLADLAQRLRDGRLKAIVGAVRPLAEAPAAFAPEQRTPGKTIIQITEGS